MSGCSERTDVVKMEHDGLLEAYLGLVTQRENLVRLPDV